MAGRLSDDEWRTLEGCVNVSPGTCNVMGTALTMAALAESLGMMLPGSAALSAMDARRLAIGEATGAAAVARAARGTSPDRVMTAGAFDNAVRVLLALSGSTNAVVHLIALAGRLGVRLPLARFAELSETTPVLADVKPSGPYLIEDFAIAGGVPTVLRELGELLALDALGGTDASWAEVLRDVPRATGGGDPATRRSGRTRGGHRGPHGQPRTARRGLQTGGRRSAIVASHGSRGRVP